MNTKSCFIPAKIALLAMAATLNTAAADDSLETLKKEVVKSYVAIAGHTTANADAKAGLLKEAITKFAAAPSAALHQQAKDAWNSARLPVLRTEVFNIGTPETTTVTKVLPYRRIESLLWGSDESVDGPGARSFDFFAGGKNADALKQLNENADIAAAEAAAMAADWKVGGGEKTAVAKFAAQATDDALKQIFANITTLSEQLRTVRIGKAYESRDQKDESANDSDLTHAELIYSCSGLANVIAGAYVGQDRVAIIQGNGPLQLTEKVDAKRGKALKLSINRVMLAVTNFRPPFDRALLAPDDSPAREAIKEMMDALEELTAETNAAAKALGLSEVEAKKAE